MTYVLVGAGGLGRKTLAALRVRLHEVVAFADRDPAKHLTRIDGVPCFGVAEAVRRFPTATYVVTIWGAYSTHRIRDTERELDELGVAQIVPFGEVLRSVGASHYFMGAAVSLENLRALEVVSGFWGDAASSFEYSRQVAARIAGNVSLCGDVVPGLPYVPGAVYRPAVREVVIDGGAYNGDTLQQWLDAPAPFAGWLAVEPHPVSAAMFRIRLAGMPDAIQERVRLVECALGREIGEQWFPAHAWVGAAAVPEGSAPNLHRVIVAPLDLPPDFTESPTLLKLDVEGAEIEAIAGARETIQKYRPVVAACVYHTPDHLWRVPLALRELLPDARFYLRPHMAEGWDTVCYAVPPERAL